MTHLSVGTALTSEDPSRIGVYALRRRLGIGGMGVVYLAEDPVGELVAVKVVRPELSHQRHFRARFAREVQAMRKVSGEHIARLVDARTEGEMQWLAMEYVPGPTLYDYMLDHGPLPSEAVRELALGLADALQSIHQAGMIHRDLKPSNVILSPSGPKVLDFGIAHVMDATALTSTGQQIGSIAWMAPEQLVHGAETPATDVHAWAAVVHFAATGMNPYGEGRPQALAVRISNGQWSLSGGQETPLAALLAASLQLEPLRRPTTEQILARLHGVGQGLEETRLWPDGDPTIIGSRAGASPSSRAAQTPRGWIRGAWWALGAFAMAAVVFAVMQRAVGDGAESGRPDSPSAQTSSAAAQTDSSESSLPVSPISDQVPDGRSYWQGYGSQANRYVIQGIEAVGGQGVLGSSGGAGGSFCASGSFQDGVFTGMQNNTSNPETDTSQTSRSYTIESGEFFWDDIPERPMRRLSDVTADFKTIRYIDRLLQSCRSYYALLGDGP